MSEVKKSIKHTGSLLYHISFLILLLLASLIIVPTMLLPVNITISPLTFAISAALTLAIYYLNFGVSQKTVINTFIGSAVIITVLIIASQVLDLSYDGIRYHKAAVGALKSGWNPTVTSIDSWAFEQPLRNSINSHSIWVDHYSRGTWYIGAGFYAITGNIECGKAYNLLMMLALFGLLNEFLIKRGLKKWQCLVISLLAAVNPITVAQSISYYNDACLMLSLFICVICMTELFYERQRNTYLLLFLGLVIGTNVKFTGLAYCLVFCGVYLIMLIYWVLKEKAALARLLLPAVAIIAGILLFTVAGGPYISNYQDHGHPLYPLAGENSVDIMASNQPDSFADMNILEKNFYAIFSSVENISGEVMPEPQLKVPFTYTVEELKKLDSTDLRIGGYGVFFGPIITISVCVILLFTFLCTKNNPKLRSILLLNTMITVGLTLFITESWWARYSIYLYGAVAAALTLLFRLSNQRPAKILKAAVLSFCLLVTVNTALFYPAGRIHASQEISYEIEMLRKVSARYPISIFFGDKWLGPSGLYDNLADAKIVFTIATERNDEMIPALNEYLYYQLDAIAE